MKTSYAIRQFMGCALVLFLTQVSCSFGDAAQKAEPCVNRFHDQLDAEQYSRIYEHASQEFRDATNEKDFTEFMRAVHTKLGASTNSKQVGFNVFKGTGGTSVTLTYETQFVRGQGQETFRTKVEGESCQIVGYNIQSRELILH